LDIPERLLTPRILYFGSRSIVWCCKKGKAGKLSDLEDTWQRMPENALRLFQYEDSAYMDDLDTEEALRLTSCWAGVVEAYSRLAVTKSEDKLIALSGIAHSLAMGSRRRTYLTGIWESILLPSLLWEVRQSRHPKPLVFRAPSWSWASVDGLTKTNIIHAVLPCRQLTPRTRYHA